LARSPIPWRPRCPHERGHIDYGEPPGGATLSPRHLEGLFAHYAHMGDQHLRELFAADPERGIRFTLEAASLSLEYSEIRIDAETLQLLVALAVDCDLPGRRAAMFRGELINSSEKRAALHTALRTLASARIVLDGVNVVTQVHVALDCMAELAGKIRNGQWLGHTGKCVRNVVNIAIGGSNLGPVMAYEALRHHRADCLRLRFVSNVDGTDLIEATRDLEPEETLFIVCSKSFGTLETLTSAHAARAWSPQKLRDGESVTRHFVAVSTNAEAVAKIQHRTGRPVSDVGPGWWPLLGGFRDWPIDHDRDSSPNVPIRRYRTRRNTDLSASI